MERDVIDLCFEVELIERAARDRAPELAERMEKAMDFQDNTDPDLAKLSKARRMFTDLPESEQRRILGGWKPAGDRPSGKRVAASMLESGGLTRVLMINAIDKLYGGEVLAEHEYVFSDSTTPVTVTIREGAAMGEVLDALDAIKAKIKRNWAQMIDQAPRSDYGGGCKGQVWKAEDFFGCFVGFLVTEFGDLDRPIAFIVGDNFGQWEMEEAEALAIAEGIADDPRTAGYLPCIDLRPYGHANSLLPTPTFLYSLSCEPVGAQEDGSRAQPFPYCRFQAMRRREQQPAIDAEPGDDIGVPNKGGASEGGAAPAVPAAAA